MAAVPSRSREGASDTDELPVVADAGDDQPAARTPMRYRWRILRRGAGWTMAGLWFSVICWALWAVTSRALDSAGFALGLVLATAALVFVVAQLLGRVVLEGSLGRQRSTAWPSHAAVFVLLAVGGVAFLQRTWWVMEAWTWVKDQLL